MILHPFPLLHPHRDRLTVAWWNKLDEQPLAGAAEACGATALAHLQQAHGAAVHHVHAAVDATREGDAMVTEVPGLLLATKSADCQSLVLYSPERNIVCTVHAGWRGLRDGVIPSAVGALRKEFYVDPRTLLVGVAPSLGQCCAEFSDPVRELPDADPSFIRGNHVDLQGIADAQLEHCGVSRRHIDRMTLCTKCNADKLWSYRAAPDPVRKGFHNVLGAVLR